MAKKANIVSFNDAKAASRQHAAKNARRTQATRRINTSHSVDALEHARIDWSMASSRGPRTAHASLVTHNARALGDMDFAEDVEFETDPLPGEGNARAFSDKQNENRSFMSEFSRRRKERAKARADRKFAKQYEEVTGMAAPQEDAPRPALYEAKMGATHRKAARMQQAAFAMPQTAKINPVGWLSQVWVSPRILKAGTAVLCLVLTAAFLYTPAQQYYQAQRDRDRLAAEYAMLEERNESLNVNNTMLSSNAGMEDAARQKYGYVVAGDQTAVVMGLSDTTTDTSRNSEGIEANVLSSAVKAPEEWYTPYLDAFFGVE